LSLSEILERLQTLTADKEVGAAAAQAVVEADLIAASVDGTPPLSLAERAAIRDSAALAQRGIQYRPADEEPHVRHSRAAFSEVLRQAEVSIRYQVGDGIWTRLDPRTTDLLTRGEASAQQEDQLDTERKDFRGAVLHLADALLNEIDVRFWQPVLRTRRCGDELKRISGEFAGKPRWGSVVKLLEGLKAGQGHQIKAAAREKGVDIELLIRWVEGLNTLRTEGRNPSAHNLRIDPAKWDKLRRLLYHQRLIVQVFTALHKNHR
jgi:hypothetical protein